MQKRSFFIRFAAMLAVVLAAAALLAPATALAKEYDIAELRIDASFNSAGDLRIHEVRTFSFDGSFSWVEWRLLTKGSQGIEIHGVTAGGRAFRQIGGDSGTPGTYWVDDRGDEVLVRVSIRAEDEDLPVELDYTAKGAVQRWADCGELSWQFVGEGWGVRTREASVRIAAPQGVTRDDVRAWAHGPLNGLVTIEDNGDVILTVDRVPANTFVEARVLYPASAVVAAPLAGGDRRAQVLEQEGELAAEANQQRTAARWQYFGLIALVALLSAGCLAFATWAFLRYGREYSSSFPGGYFREDPRPDMHPAVVGSLMRMGQAADSDISATLLNLADNKVITMEQIEVDSDGISGVFGGKEKTYLLKRVPGAEVTHPLDRELLSIVFDQAAGGSNEIDLVRLKAYAKANPESFTSQLKAWKETAGVEAESLGFVETDSKTWQVFVGIAAALAGAAGIGATVVLEDPIPALIGVPVAIACAVITGLMRRRSRKGNELFQQYKALKQYLLDFSRLKEAPPASVILWNRFLVLAVVFGVAEQVMSQLKVVLPEVVNNPQFATTYWWMYAGWGHSSPVNALQAGFVSASEVAHSAMSSSGGFGGGFSGGGGFGGGGGGGGAG